jgi:general secretion pathway protein H
MVFQVGKGKIKMWLTGKDWIKNSSFRVIHTILAGIKTKKGFTLLELLIVLLLMGLMLALVGPQITIGLSAITLKSSAKRIATTLNYARGQAIVKKTPYQVSFNNETGTYWVAEKSRSSKQDQSSPIKELELPETIKIKDKGSVIFYPNGSSSGGEIIIINEKEKGYLIRVDIITGLPTIEPIDNEERS